MKYAKKSLGQNFLIDLNIVKKITSLTNISNKNILEIGPGKGMLTDQLLAQKPKSLILIEKDNILFENLKIKYKKFKQVKIYNDDILKFNLEEKLQKDTIIFGNLPYNISSQILTRIIRIKTNPARFLYLVFMFQKEMAARIIGKFGTPEYGRLSILTNYKLNILSKFNVSPNCFFPKPKVDSTVLLFKPKNKIKEKIKNIESLEKVTNILFSNKRKMINKNIKKILKKDQLQLVDNLNLKSRPSDLKPEKYYKITELFEIFN
jgi:16S rRNA (adenine1518-N6/adenine1519-N6)-dimethyltransferase